MISQPSGPQDDRPVAIDLAALRAALGAQADAAWKLPVGLWIVPASLIGCVMVAWTGVRLVAGLQIIVR